jgi:hypothetical protein
MTTTNEHPSTFEIDVWFAEGEADGATAAHMRSCAPCGRYVEALRNMESGGGTVVPLARPRKGRRFVAPVAAALTMAAALALFVRSRSAPDEESYVGVKGGTAVELLVRSTGPARVWDGKAAVRPGDAIALRVACDRRARVTVASRSEAGWTRVREEACPPGPAVLPFTLVVDDEAGAEHIAVIVTRGPVRDDALGATIEAPPRGTWVERYDLEKELTP